MLKRALGLCWRWTWRGIAAGLILAAVLLTVARLLLPFAGEYRDELEQQVESYLGSEISIGEVDIGWLGLLPRIRLQQLVIEDVGPGGESLAFAQAFLSVRPAWTEGGPTLAVADIALVGLELPLRIDAEGRVHALGAALDPAALTGGPVAPADGAAAPEVIATLAGIFGVSRLQLLDTTLVVTGPEGSSHRLRDVELRLANAGRSHRLSLEAGLPEGWGRQLRIVLSFEGDPLALRDGRGQLFVEADRLELRNWSTLLPELPLRASGGRLDLRLWSGWRDGRLDDAQAEVVLERPVLGGAGAGEPVAFERVAGHLHAWRPPAAQWQVDIGELQVLRGGSGWDGERLSIVRGGDGGWHAAAEGLRVDDLAALAALLPQPPKLAGRVLETAPRGRLRDLRLAVAGDGDFRLQAEFLDLGWGQSGDVPGMAGLDGRVRFDNDGGRFELASTGVTFDAPALFRAPLRVVELEASVDVHLGAGSLVLDAPAVHLRNEHLEGRGRARIEVADDGATMLDLQFAYRDGVATATPAYLPVGIMGEPVVTWLDQAFRAGRVQQGSFIMHGLADGFPYRDHSGVFDVRFDVAGVTLHYGEGWPEIEELAGEVRFSGPSMTIQASAGRSRGVALERGRARFADLETGLLEVDVLASGPAADMLGVVNDSPLADRFEPVFGGARSSGRARLALDLAVPVDDVDATDVRGRIWLSDTALAQPRYDLDFEGLDGMVRFTGSSLDIENLRGRLRGRPIRIDAETRDGTAQIRGRGSFSLAELLPGAAEEGPLRAVTGRSQWQILLRLPLTSADPSLLRATSDLRGTRVGLPAPFAKPPAAVRPVQLDVPLAQGRVREAGLRYGERIRIAVEFGGGGDLDVRRLGVGFGRAAALPEAPGIRLAGRVESLPLDAWLAHAPARENGGDSLALVDVDLTAVRIEVGDYRLSDVRLEGRPVATAQWRLDVASNEAGGSIVWPRGGSRGDPVRARFEWVDLALLRGQGGGEAGAIRGRLDDPRALPPLDVRIERLKLADLTVNEVTLVTGNSRAGRTIHRLDFHTDSLDVSGQGIWRGQPRLATQMRLNLRSDNFGQALADLGYPDTLGGGEGQLTLDLEWPAEPWEPELAQLEGFIDVDVKDGVLRQVNPGAARLLGMFSLDSIPFRSLLQRGLIFHHMRGRVDLTEGDAYTNGFRMDTAVGTIRISGRTGLVARDYDQEIVVEPELSDSLPVLGFLSGGPIGAATVALLQGVMRNLGQDLDKAGKVEYSVTGSWEDPKVERKGAGAAESGAGSATPGDLPR